SFFGSYTQETRLMLDAYAGFLDRLRRRGVFPRRLLFCCYSGTTVTFLAPSPESPPPPLPLPDGGAGDNDSLLIVGGDLTDLWAQNSIIIMLL
ncbi:hypothetical protein, partial [uncultured Intestinimonas sp.]|uniref:hypothetical protein n=1 Tax=uncultured Intestinimonas sp. TaxID=1689265 RepID=UPI0025EF5A08